MNRLYLLILLFGVVLIGNIIKVKSTDKKSHIETLIRQASRWSVAAQQDDSPIIALLHANYGAGYLWALKDIATDQEIYDRDMTALTDPLYPPLKRNFHIDSRLQIRDTPHVGHQNQLGGIPINIETRGPSEDYQQMGMLYKESISDTDSTPGNNNDSSVLPLYGKPTYRGSNKYLYYTASDKMNQVKIPLTYNNKDCTDDQGCEEINDGSAITVPSTLTLNHA